MEMIKEGKATIKAETPKIVSKEMGVFYNPVMKFNRGTSILLLNTLEKKNMKICLPLAASGIRGARFALELPKNKIKSIDMNDLNPKACSMMKKNLKQSKVSQKKVKITNEEANKFLMQGNCYDYIDIDPFGSPNYFLDAAITRLFRYGVLAVTATDTSCLAGSFPKPCLRKYWATPKRDHNMHETGLRILIRKCQLVAAQYDKALTPIFSFYKDHYYRIFFTMDKGKERTDKIINQHGMFNEAGPLWLGRLWDPKLVAKMCKENKEEENQAFLDILKKESVIPIVGTAKIHSIAEKNKLKRVPKTEPLLKAVKAKGKKATVSHFDNLAIRTNLHLKAFETLCKKQSSK
jgi:tRNA (guanine26-N2/guanine27-N2)-dimethyltransferase